METSGKFYLGRIVDPVSGRTMDEPLMIDPGDLTTHAVVVGMTGSGKTGLCIDLLEEAALNGIPALMIDPKGDITNSLLHFPSLAPQDFLPWVNADQARREGQTVAEAAAQAAAAWRAGISEWGMGPDRLQALKNAVGFTVYTPGSTSGVPVSILASFKAPSLSWEIHREILREKISGTVTALLGLVGLNAANPVRSREHILLSNIFEFAWSQGRDMDLGELILQTQNPPFERLGVFDVNTFFAEKDRFELAMLLNNMLAAPAFQSWIEGHPLDIETLLYLPDGRARHSVFYIAHLSDAERMFFVTLLYSAVESWMRTQPGSLLLRLILYFDEIYGFLPPVSNPPSKQPMLRMLKQARAFGVGQVLVTQNPVDLDYKALSNAGAWFIGKLQTEQDRARLLDGLSTDVAAGLDRGVYDRLISGLGKRVFLLHNIHGKKPVLFQSRWAMNYLPGPLTRVQIPHLNQLAGVESSESTPPIQDSKAGGSIQASEVQDKPLDQLQAIPVSESPFRQTQFDTLPAGTGSLTRPAVPAGIQEYFLPNNLTLSEVLRLKGASLPKQAEVRTIHYRPYLLAQAHVRFTDRKYNLDHEKVLTAIVEEPDRRSAFRWEDFMTHPIDADKLDSEPVPQARFTSLATPFSDARFLKALERDYADTLYRTVRVSVRVHQELDVFAGPDVSQAEFRRLCAEQARQRRDEELARLEAAYDGKFAVLEERLERELRELEADETELSQRRMEEMGTNLEYIFSLFNKRRRRFTTTLTKRRMTARAKEEVKESRHTVSSFERKLEALAEEEKQEVEHINQYWTDVVTDTSEIPISPYRKNIFIELFGVAWMPWYLVEFGSESFTLPGFEAALASVPDSAWGYEN